MLIAEEDEVEVIERVLMGAWVEKAVVPPSRSRARAAFMVMVDMLLCCAWLLYYSEIFCAFGHDLC